MSSWSQSSGTSSSRPSPATGRRTRPPTRSSPSGSGRSTRYAADGPLLCLVLLGERGLVRSLLFLHRLQRGEREALAREEGETHPDTNRHLDCLEHEAVREAGAVGDAVLHEG